MDITVVIDDQVTVSLEAADDQPLDAVESLLRRAGDEAIRLHRQLAVTEAE